MGRGSWATSRCSLGLWCTKSDLMLWKFHFMSWIAWFVQEENVSLTNTMLCGYLAAWEEGRILQRLDHLCLDYRICDPRGGKRIPWERGVEVHYLPVFQPAGAGHTFFLSCTGCWCRVVWSELPNTHGSSWRGSSGSAVCDVLLRMLVQEL